MLDVDGVLIDGKPEEGAPWYTNLEEDLGISPQALREDFFNQDWRDVVEGRSDLVPALEAYLARAQMPVCAEELVTYWFAQDARLVQPVLDSCRRIRSAGIRIFLATNQEHCRAKYLMDELGLRGEVDGMVYSARLGAQKPALRFYYEAMRLTGCAPEHHVLVDDTEANVAGALKAGWQAVVWSPEMTLTDVLDVLA